MYLLEEIKKIIEDYSKKIAIFVDMDGVVETIDLEKGKI